MKKGLMRHSALALALLSTATADVHCSDIDPHKPKRRSKGEKARARKQRRSQ